MRPPPPEAAALPFAGRHVAVVAAHPDDEVIGFGGQMASVARLSLIHLTDGVPSRGAARAHGFASTADYAKARRRELEAAIALAGVPVDWAHLDLPDQRVSLHLVDASRWLVAVLRSLSPEVIVTHAYEGGHPDHDAAAFVTASALRNLTPRPPHWEFTSYHAGAAGVCTGAFLPGGDPVRLRLDPGQQALKRAMLASFGSQQVTLAPFRTEEEQFRPAPDHDFTRPPHPGRLLYENRRRAMRGAMWRRLARDAGAAPPPIAARLRQACFQAALRLWLPV